MYTEEEALNHRLTGWARNLPDGHVEAVFEGIKKNIEEMISWCHKGPTAARVTHVDVSWEPYQGDFRDFRIVY
jgi:acylphosphatase